MTMRLLTKDYLAENKWLVLFGAVSGIAASAILLRWPPEILAVPFALFLLNFPYIAKTQAERLRRLALIGFCLSVALVYFSKNLLPLAGLGFVGSSIFGAIAGCLRYNPPAAAEAL